MTWPSSRIAGPEVCHVSPHPTPTHLSRNVRDEMVGTLLVYYTCDTNRWLGSWLPGWLNYRGDGGKR
jgi:hypothetical protein